MAPDWHVNSNSVDETEGLGYEIGVHAQPGAVLALVGTLGAGKTQLAKGIARGLAVQASTVVNSPTYVIVNEYSGRVRIFHIDAYRLGSDDELEALGFEEMCHSNGVVLIEWADRVQRLVPHDHLKIRLSVTGEHQRLLEFNSSGPQSARLLSAIKE